MIVVRKGNVSAETALRLAQATGCDLGWLLGGGGRPPTKSEVRTAIGAARTRTGAGRAPEPRREEHVPHARKNQRGPRAAAVATGAR